MTTTRWKAEESSERGSDLVGEVELVVPARGELLFLARMTAAAVASRADFGYDQIEDLRLALDELCLMMLNRAPSDARIALRFGWSEDSIEVTAALDPARDYLGRSSNETGEPLTNDFSERILDALVDSHGFEEVEGRTVSRLRMKREASVR